MRLSSSYVAILVFAALPAFAAGHGGGASGGHGAGMSHGMSMGTTHGVSMGHSVNPSTHGATVSAAAHQAKLSGNKVGPQVRTIARSNHGHTKTHPDNHGSLVSQTAHTAHASGQKVGPQVRTVARSKSHGKAHANSHALGAVGKHTHSSANSVLGTP
jgi:hypothetical protein